jgi:hypothetical protein
MTSEWLKETVPFLKNGNWLYKIICFLMGKRKKKLTYEEIYLLLYGLNRNKKNDEGETKKKSMHKILELYKYHHNNKLPKGINYDD